MMLDYILFLAILVLAVEAVTEIIVSSKLTDPIRFWIRDQIMDEDGPPENTIMVRFWTFVDALVNCGYCTSVWISAFFCLVFRLYDDYHFFDWVVITFAVHRLSNWLHVCYELVRKGRVNSIDLNINSEDE